VTTRALAAPLAGVPFRITRRHRPRAARRVAIVAHGADRWIMLTVALLVALSVVMVFNTSYFFAGERFGDPYWVLRKHLASIALGAVVCAVAARLRASTYERLAYPALAAITLALVVVLVPGIGLVRGGARRWIGLGAINVQPSELAKIVVVLYLARSLVRKGARVETFSVGVLPHVIVVGVLAALVAREPDFGTAALLAVLLVAMLFAGGVRLRHLVVPLLPALPLAAYLIHSSPYRLRRVMVFLDPWQHPRDAGFQLVQSFLAFGSGGTLGSGLFALLAIRGFRVALRHPTPFGRLVAFGVTVILVVQAGINMAVVLGLLPTKGLALPFVSYGGSAMIGALASAGVLLALSRESG
jgi:cell division protein FtsW